MVERSPTISGVKEFRGNSSWEDGNDEKEAGNSRERKRRVVFDDGYGKRVGCLVGERDWECGGRSESQRG
jgi:hypothetical protein